jgi:hypothetical protein
MLSFLTSVFPFLNNKSEYLLIKFIFFFKIRSSFRIEFNINKNRLIGSNKLFKLYHLLTNNGFIKLKNQAVRLSQLTIGMIETKNDFLFKDYLKQK